MRAARPPLPGWLETLRLRLFATPIDIVVSFLCLYVVWRISLPLVDWLLVEANWRGTSREDCTSAGACWVFIRARFTQFMYGQYPVPERWRVDLLGGLAVVAAAALSWRGLPRRREAAIAALVVLPPFGIWLLYGGLGLPIVETREWGGLMLTLFLTVYAGLISVPLGILLALGRRSRLPLIRLASVVFIEFWRGVPIITVIVLPQALRIALPAMTNEFISLFKSTTLVLIVSIFDLLGIAQAALADPAWVGMNMEAYVFAGAIYWFACFGLSQWSRSREKRLQAAYGR